MTVIVTIHTHSISHQRIESDDFTFAIWYNLEFDENASLKIDESALTGESFVVEKSKDTILAEVPLGDRTNFFNGERGKIKNQAGKYGWISLQKHWNLHPGGDTILTLKQNRRTKRCYF